MTGLLKSEGKSKLKIVIRKDEFMERWKKCYMIITAIIFAIACVATFAFAHKGSHLFAGTAEIITTILI